VFLSDEHRECDIRRSNFNSNCSWRNCHFLPPIITPSSKHAPIWYYPNGTMQSYLYNPFYSIYTSYSSDWSSETGQDITCAVLSKCTHMISDYLVVRISIDKIQSVTATSVTHTAHPSSNITIAVQRGVSRHNEGQLFPPDTCIILFDRKNEKWQFTCRTFPWNFQPSAALPLYYRSIMSTTASAREEYALIWAHRYG